MQKVKDDEKEQQQKIDKQEVAQLLSEYSLQQTVLFPAFSSSSPTGIRNGQLLDQSARERDYC
jgi:hypothetical protein